jgi:tRNA-dihydrouridine synthase B
MLARGSLGNPWRFARLLGAYEGRPSAVEVAAELEWLIARAEDHLGADRAGRYLRKFYPWYADSMGLTRRQREPLITAPTTAQAHAALREIAHIERALAA